MSLAVELRGVLGVLERDCQLAALTSIRLGLTRERPRLASLVTTSPWRRFYAVTALSVLNAGFDSRVAGHGQASGLFRYHHGLAGVCGSAFFGGDPVCCHLHLTVGRDGGSLLLPAES